MFGGAEDAHTRRASNQEIQPITLVSTMLQAVLTPASFFLDSQAHSTNLHRFRAPAAYYLSSCIQLRLTTHVKDLSPNLSRSVLIIAHYALAVTLSKASRLLTQLAVTSGSAPPSSTKILLLVQSGLSHQSSWRGRKTEHPRRANRKLVCPCS